LDPRLPEEALEVGELHRIWPGWGARSYRRRSAATAFFSHSAQACGSMGWAIDRGAPASIILGRISPLWTSRSCSLSCCWTLSFFLVNCGRKERRHSLDMWTSLSYLRRCSIS